MANIRYRKYISHSYPIAVLLISLGIAYSAYRRDRAIQVENASLEQVIEQKDSAVATLLRNTRTFVYDFFGMTYMGNAQEFVDQNILLYGAYEKYILFLMKDLAHNLNDPHLVFFDIGAYTGQHSLFMSRYTAVVHAFEPYPPAAARFRQMIEVNGLKNITLWPIGLGREQGSLAFKVPPPWNPAVGSLTKNWYSDKKNEQITVKVERGDNLPPDVTSDIDLIKLDTEGYEKNIIIGLRETLRRRRPIIVMEFNTGGDEKWASQEDVFKHCPPGYKLFLITPLNPLAEGRYRLEPFPPDPRASKKLPLHPNVLLFPSEKEDKIPLTNIGLEPATEEVGDAFPVSLWPTGNP